MQQKTARLTVLIYTADGFLAWTLATFATAAALTSTIGAFRTGTQVGASTVGEAP